jgi:hypothetical protein
LLSGIIGIIAGLSRFLGPRPPHQKNKAEEEKSPRHQFDGKVGAHVSKSFSTAGILRSCLIFMSFLKAKGVPVPHLT